MNPTNYINTRQHYIQNLSYHFQYAVNTHTRTHMKPVAHNCTHTRTHARHSEPRGEKMGLEGRFEWYNGRSVSPCFGSVHQFSVPVQGSCSVSAHCSIIVSLFLLFVFCRGGWVVWWTDLDPEPCVQTRLRLWWRHSHVPSCQPLTMDTTNWTRKTTKHS